MKTAIGNIASYLSVAVWSATMAFVMQCGNIPPLLLVGLTCLLLGLLQAAGELRGDGPKGFRARPAACMLAFMGHLGFRALCFPALFLIDPIEVSNLVQVWIGGAMIFGVLAAGGGLGTRHVLGIACFAAGALALLYDGIGAGHLMALCGGVWFGWYMANGPAVEGMDGKASAIGNLAAGLLVIYFSFVAEWPWTFSGSDLFWLAGALIVSNIGVMLWNFGLKHGEPRKAKISVLLTPVVSVAWICLLGGVRLDGVHMFSTAAITMAGLVLSPYIFRAAKTADA